MNKKALALLNIGNLDDTAKQHILDYLKLGLGVGGTVGLGSLLKDYVSNLAAGSQADAEEDDDTMYVDLPQELGMPNTKMASGPTGSEHALAMMGMLGTGFGSYALIKKLYKQMKLKQLQDEIDEAQQFSFQQMARFKPELADKAINLPSEEGEDDDPKPESEFEKNSSIKSAENVGPLASLGSVPWLLSMLLLAGSGVGAYKYLDSTNPKLKRENARDRLLSPKVQFVNRTPVEEETEYDEGMEEGMIASASVANSPDLYEHVLKLVTSFEDAADYDAAHVVKAAAAGHAEEIRSLIVEKGLEEALDFCHTKSAASNADKEDLALSWVAADPTVSEALKPIVAAEFHEHAPMYFKLAQALDDETQNALMAASALYIQEQRKEAAAEILAEHDLEKSASAATTTPEERLKVIEKLLAC
jgi:hypothetical protein